MGRCLHHGHHRGRLKHQLDLDDPCPYCASSIREGIFDPDLFKLLPELQRPVARLWSQLEVPISDDIAITLIGCWTTAAPKRLLLGGCSFTPQQLVYSLCWGDQGPWRIEHICDHPACVNPFHLRIAELGHPPVEMLLPWPDGFDDAMERISVCNNQAAALLAAADTLPATQPEPA